MNFRIYETYVRQHPRYGGWYSTVSRQPSWVVKAAAVAAVVVVVVPIVLLTLAAMLVAGIVFGTLALVAGGLRTVGSLFNFSEPEAPTPYDDGRRNVRVIQR